jgi:hypothetical protein
VLIPTLLADLHAAENRAALSLLIVSDGFDAPAENIEAVLRSAAEAIWQHCPTTSFEFGFRIYRNEKYPITHYEREDGRIVIGLNTKSTYWAQYAFQFAHEFCHALMDHSNDWRRLWRTSEHANQWVEESFCEVASLFALRSMGRSWAKTPPYPNWGTFAEHLTDYAQKRLDQAAAGLQMPFVEWLRTVEPLQRKRWTRENNTIVARELLPLFEADPAGWDALPSLNLCKRERDKTLATFLEEWSANAAANHRPFIAKVSRVFAI